MKNKLLSLISLSILAIIFIVSFASAAPVCTGALCGSVIASPLTANHDSSVTVAFNVTYEGTVNPETLEFSGTSNIGSWTILPSDTPISPLNTLEFSATLNIPKYKSGVINSIINVNIDSTNFDIVVPSITLNNNSSLLVSSSTISPFGDLTSITIKNTGNTLLEGIELTSSGDFNVGFSSNNFNLNAGDDKKINVTRTTVLKDLEIGSNSVTITATADDSTFATGIVTTEKSYCDCQNPGELEMTIKNVEVINGFGDEDDYWYLFDEIEVTLRIENNGDWDIRKIGVEWELYSTNGNRIADGDESNFNLDKGDEETITITFKLNKNIKKFNKKNALLYIKATGKIDDNDADDNDGDKTCDWASKEVEVRTDEQFVILNDFQFSNVLSCGSTVQITADVWNIGDRNQDDVYVIVYNSKLGINEKVEVGDIDAFESKSFVFDFAVPTDATEKVYYLRFTVYDEDDDVYKNDEDDKAEFSVSLNVDGTCLSSSKPLVSAVLESGGQAGKELVIKATITNTGDKLATYILKSNGYDSWALLNSIEPSLIIVESGESKEVLFKYQINKDASGSKVFEIEVTSDGESLVKQPVSISIEESKGFFSFTGNIISSSNWYLWGIGALNVILILVIIFVALRVIRNK